GVGELEGDLVDECVRVREESAVDRAEHRSGATCGCVVGSGLSATSGGTTGTDLPYGAATSAKRAYATARDGSARTKTGQRDPAAVVLLNTIANATTQAAPTSSRGGSTRILRGSSGRTTVSSSTCSDSRGCSATATAAGDWTASSSVPVEAS